MGAFLSEVDVVLVRMNVRPSRALVRSTPCVSKDGASFSAVEARCDRRGSRMRRAFEICSMTNLRQEYLNSFTVEGGLTFDMSGRCIQENADTYLWPLRRDRVLRGDNHSGRVFALAPCISSCNDFDI